MVSSWTPEVGEKQKTERKSKRVKVSVNNGHLCLQTSPRLAHTNQPDKYFLFDWGWDGQLDMETGEVVRSVFPKQYLGWFSILQAKLNVDSAQKG